MVGKYKVITLCGSTKFKEQYLEAQKRLTLEGNIVISVGLFGHSGDEEVWTEGTKAMLDDMHKRKIDMADEIFVINVGGYVGESTRSEIAYAQEQGKLRYWEHNGESLRKQLLKAPLKYTRISSKFSNARLHPVHKVYRPHHGVDYAAPSGTPVYSVADGTVVFAGWGGGGGNTLKIKHAGNLQTGYLHLKSFAKGIKVGTKVSQGQLIGYVGSTGTSTGPHLDYRIWKNGTAIDPLKVPQEPAEPIASAHKARFEAVRDRVVAELEGKEVEGGIITDDDIFVEGK